MLVNLVFEPSGGMVFDPFAGIDGIVIEARASGWNVFSLDSDPALRFGLRDLANLHAVASAAAAAALRPEMDEPIDRKGASVVCLRWQKPGTGLPVDR